MYSKVNHSLDRQTEKKDSTSSPDQPASVTAITQYSKGFACSAGLGLVCLYEISNENDNYRKTAEISVSNSYLTFGEVTYKRGNSLLG